MSQYKRILVPTDFSECSKAALGYALAVAERLGSSVDVFHAWDIGWAEPDLTVWSGDNKTSLAAYAEQEADLLMTETLAPYPDKRIGRKIVHGQAHKQIVDEATHGAYDLIVMGTHGRAGFAHLVMGSVAQKVVRLAPCPVLTVPLRTQATE
jgi:nucleotide-binding universal stress UspA family protein